MPESRPDPEVPAKARRLRRRRIKAPDPREHSWRRAEPSRQSPVAESIFRTGDDRAEIAFAVADSMQGKGLGTILLAHLAQAASANGIAIFEAEVLPGNHRMLEMFRRVVSWWKQSRSPGNRSRVPYFDHRRGARFLRVARPGRRDGGNQTVLVTSSVAVIGASRAA